MPISPEVVGTAYVGIGVLSLAFFRAVYRYWDKPGSTGFGILVGAISLWSVSIGISYVHGGQTGSVLAYSIRLLAAQLVTIGSVLLAVEFTNWRPLSTRVVAPLVAYLVAIQSLVWTNAAHELVFFVDSVSTGATLAVDYGPAFWLHAAIGYGFVLFAIGLLLRDALGSIGTRSRQSLVLALALVFPLFLNAGSNFGIVSTAYDPTPLGFLVSEILYAWALYGAGFLSVVPVARRAAIEAMDDAYVSLDRQHVVVDFNDAARRIFDLEDAVGKSAADAFADHPSIVSGLTSDAEFDSDSGVRTEQTIERDGETHHYHLTVTALSNASNDSGSVLVMRDITSLKRREEEVRQRESELDLLRQVFTRVLRHNLRNSLCIVKGHGETIAREAEEPFDELGVAIAAEGDRLEDVAQKTTTIATLVNEHELVTHDLAEDVRAITDALADRHPDATIERSVPASAPIRASTGLRFAVQNLVENAIEHTGAAPTIHVTVVRRGTETVLEVADDGPGIPRHEIDVLTEGRETALRHSSGIGLWLVDWVVAHSDGDLSFEVADSGTTVTVRFRSVDGADS